MKHLILVSALIAMLVIGGVVLYLATSPTGNGVVASRTSQSTQTSGIISNSAPEPASKFLGYIPTGYKVAPHLANAYTFPCPKGLNSTQCATFQQTCGNGVCDPNERCDTCPFDCPVFGAQVCDPFTGRAGAPTGVCLLGNVPAQGQ